MNHLDNLENIPKGFRFTGICCGISNKKKKDLALFYSTSPCVATGLFTKNRIQAAPIIVSKKHLSINSNNIQTIIANSGSANAATGKQGIKDAAEMCSLTAKYLGLKPQQVLVASTGVIGTYLPMNKIRYGIKKLVTLIKSPTGGSHIDAVKAIMTTDTFPKVVSKKLLLPSINPNPSTLTTVSIWACAKGSGMIHPDLATLLCFVFTDVNISKNALDYAVKDAISKSFNCITIDGETSTNDTVFVLSNGLAGNKKITAPEECVYKNFSNALSEVLKKLAEMIISDGEGATKVIKIEIKNTKSLTEAKKIAKAVATSPLVKTAIFGGDLNWGRIIAAIGRSGANFLPDKIDISLNGLRVAKNSTAVKFGTSWLNHLKNTIKNNKSIEIMIDLHSGKTNFEYFTTDLSYEYVKINSSYRT